MAIDTYSPIIMYKSAESYRTNEHRSEQNPDLRKKGRWAMYSRAQVLNIIRRKDKQSQIAVETGPLRSRGKGSRASIKNQKIALEPTTPVRYAIRNSNNKGMS